ncbi:hypothetical protein RJ641_010438, partial [Dillenia turbinata]
KGLVEVLDRLEQGQLKEDSTLSSLVMQIHKNRQGAPRKRKCAPPGIKSQGRSRMEESFYENPYPESIRCSKKHFQPNARTDLEVSLKDWKGLLRAQWSG